MLELISERHHAEVGVGVEDSIDIHAVVEGEGVCEDDGHWSARGLLQVTIVDVCHYGQRKP